MGGDAHPSTELSSSPQDCLLLLHTHMRGLLFCNSPLSPSPSCKWNSMDLYCASSPCSAPLVVAARGAGASFSLSPSVLNFCYLACSGFY